MSADRPSDRLERLLYPGALVAFAGSDAATLADLRRRAEQLGAGTAELDRVEGRTVEVVVLADPTPEELELARLRVAPGGNVLLLGASAPDLSLPSGGLVLAEVDLLMPRSERDGREVH